MSATTYDEDWLPSDSGTIEALEEYMLVIEIVTDDSPIYVFFTMTSTGNYNIICYYFYDPDITYTANKFGPSAIQFDQVTAHINYMVGDDFQYIPVTIHYAGKTLATFRIGVPNSTPFTHFSYADHEDNGYEMRNSNEMSTYFNLQTPP